MNTFEHKKKNTYVHLHVHTEFSLLDGASRITKLLNKTKEMGMDSIAITDHGGMFGIVQFYKQAVKTGIKPILGCEVYTSKGRYTERDSNRDKNQYHLVLLAENNIGLSNLMKIVSEGYVNGFYYRPRIDKELLKAHNEGIIALSGCLAGEIQQHILNRNYNQAKKTALAYEEIFGKNHFYLELQDHGIKEQKMVNQQLIKLSRETGIPLVATNDIHYVEKKDARVHDVLLCIQTGKTIDEEGRMKFPTQEFYLKTPQEMAELFPNIQDAIDNTVDIAERCNVSFDFDTIHLPEYKVPDGYTNGDYLRKLCYTGLKQRYETITDTIEKRLQYELGVIENMGYVDYFLIVWDFIKYAKDHDIMVGPGRGSAAGSLVAYTLGIIDIDPIKYGLIFERFLNPERVTMPDIDIDFCYERREEVIDYVVKKYGHDKVAQIVTFGTMAARGAIRDVGRTLNLSYGQVDVIAKQIPMELGMTIDRALEVNKKLKEMYETEESVKNLIDLAKAVEGLPRHTSTHAAGVVISKLPITEYVPLSRNKDSITTQFTMTELEELGLLKMDFLGLRTLTVIRDAIQLIKENHKKTIDFSHSDYEDPKVYKMFSKGETLGIFQFESTGMRQFLKELKPTHFEDIVAANAMYRPGPMQFIPKFIQGKHNPESIQYDHPLLEPILRPTYGVIIYQEQVMQIVREIGGFSMGRSDLVRRAMSKKKMDVMERERKHFIYGKKDAQGNIELPGAVTKGVNETTANKIYDDMIDFAKYAFNKSHSAAYAVLAYQTAWLKTYYPVEFMAALISSIMGSSNSVSLYIQECKRLDIDILPPDVNESYSKFTVKDEKIRFGIAAVKNVGLSAIESIVEAREKGDKFISLTDFCQRADMNSVNKRTVESLIKCGAFDSIGAYRAQLLAIYDKILEGVQQDKKRNIKGQFSIFETMDTSESSNVKEDNLPKIKEFPEKTRLGMEKEMLGVYISGHPLSSYEEELNEVATITSNEINEAGKNLDESDHVVDIRDGKFVVMGGMIVSKKNKTTKNNNMMAFAILEDLYGAVELIIFPKTYDAYLKHIQEDNIVMIEGRVSMNEEEEPKIICSKIVPLVKQNNKKLFLKISKEKSKNILQDVKKVLRNHSGNTPVYVYLEKDNKTIRANRDYWIDIESSDLIHRLTYILGSDCVKVC